MLKKFNFKKEFVMTIIFLSFILLITANCKPSSNSVFQTPGLTEEKNYFKTTITHEIIFSPTTYSMGTPSITSLPTTGPIPQKTPTSKNNVTQLQSPTPNVINGELLIKDKNGILRLSLESGEQKYLFQKEPDWTTWDSSFSPTGDLVALWVQKENSSSLWMSSTDLWDPKQVMFLSEKDYCRVDFNWLSMGNYLLFQSSREGEFGLTYRAESYILDIKNKPVESVFGWTGSGTCSLLAISSRTDQVITSCPIPIEGDQLIYAMFEASGEFWTLENEPDLIKELSSEWYELAAWSRDSRFVSYSLNDQVSGFTLYYSPVDFFEPVKLVKSNDNFFEFLSISPNGKYVSYSGKCPTQVCQKIIDVNTKKIIWTSDLVSKFHTISLAWSPDNNFFAISLLDGVIIFDIYTGKEVFRLSDLDAYNMVWISDK